MVYGEFWEEEDCKGGQGVILKGFLNHCVRSPVAFTAYTGVLLKSSALNTHARTHAHMHTHYTHKSRNKVGTSNYYLDKMTDKINSATLR